MTTTTNTNQRPPLRQGNPRNPRRITPEQLSSLDASLNFFGDLGGIIYNRRSKSLVGGHQRIQTFRNDESAKVHITETFAQPDAAGTVALGYVLANDTRYSYREVDWDEQTETLAMIAANKHGGEFVPDEVALLLRQLGSDSDLDLTMSGFSQTELDALIKGAALGAKGVPDALRLRFGVPPFSVLDTRQGYWMERRKAWLSLGIQSEVGRGENLLKMSDTARQPDPAKRHRNTMAKAFNTQNLLNNVMAQKGYAGGDAWQAGGTSIFDPVLCELAYRWFCPPGGRILDPFAGGSVRGVTAGWLGYRYTGIDLRPEQVQANEHQARGILENRQQPKPKVPDQTISDPQALTPVEKRGAFWFKRDDLFEIAGVRGGKVRTCLALAMVQPKAQGLTTAGSRMSPQVNIVASIGRHLGIPVQCHVPKGMLSPEVQAAKDGGAEIVQHKAGYNNVIIARAREAAKEKGWEEIPFGMECEEAVNQTRRQAANLPGDIKRLVVPVGSGMSLSGILHGLNDAGNKVPVLAVQVGADPTERLNKYAPADWKARVAFVKSALDYHAQVPNNELEGITLDPIYEAKCVTFLEPGDCLWLVGVRKTALPRRSAQPRPANTVLWKLSAKSACRKIDCTLHGITKEGGCNGQCCHSKSASFWPPNAGSAADATVVTCPKLAANGCTFAETDKPVTCLLCPFKLNENRTMIIHFRANAICGGCFQAPDAPRIIDALAGNFTALFGPDIYAEMLASVDAGQDYEFECPPEIWAAYQLEETKMAPGRELPIARSTYPQAAEQPAPVYEEPTGPTIPQWLVGDSKDCATLAPGAYDLLFSCPPYADLEVYSDDPRDLSAIASKDYAAFVEAYGRIIERAASMLNPNRFAVWVVSDVRAPDGSYRGFVCDTINAFKAAGLELYNEAVLINSVGSLAIRVSRQFSGSRKLGRTHQTVLVFVKGDAKRATEAIGPVEFGEVIPEPEAEPQAGNEA